MRPITKSEGGWPKATQSHHNQGPREKAPTKTKKNPNLSNKTVNIPVAKISLTRGPGAIKKIRNLVKVKVETTKQEPRLYGPTVTPGQRVDKVRSVPVGHHPRPGPTPATTLENSRRQATTVAGDNNQHIAQSDYKPEVNTYIKGNPAEDKDRDHQTTPR